MTYDTCFSDYSLCIDSSAISKRQTNTDSKTDYVWFDVTASNNDFTYCVSYKLTYNLYNNGWLLEDFSRFNSSSTPKSYPSEEDAFAAINQYYSDYSYMGETQDATSIEYRFEHTKWHNYLVSIYDVFVTYQFSPRSGWTYSINQNEREWYPDVVGDWIYEDEDCSYFIGVSDLTGSAITIEYDLHRIEHAGSAAYPIDYIRDSSTIEPIEETLCYRSTSYPYKQYYLSNESPKRARPMYFSIWFYAGDGRDGGGFCIEGHYLTRRSE